MQAIRTYFVLALSDVRSQMQYRASFAMQTLGNFLASCVDFLGIAALFSSFGALQGWSLYEVAVLFGIVNLSFALAEGIGRGFDEFARTIREANFDRVLLRPRGTLFQVLSSRLEISRMGRLLQGAAVLALGLAGLPEPLGLGQGLLLAACVIGGTMLFLGVLFLRAAACFWTLESLEVFNILTYGGPQAVAYPLDIYQTWLRNFLLYVVPLGCLNYLPSAVLFGKDLPFPAWERVPCAPGQGAAFLALGALAWRAGVRHYQAPAGAEKKRGDAVPPFFCPLIPPPGSGRSSPGRGGAGRFSSGRSRA